VAAEAMQNWRAAPRNRPDLQQQVEELK
jgi:hypothetical protein